MISDRATTFFGMATPLFGGALVCSLPTGWIDASDLRPVPDNQEVRYFSVAMPELPLTPARHIPTRCGWSELEQSAH